MPTIPSDFRTLVELFIGPKALPEPVDPSPQQLALHNLAKRQGTIAIPTLYQNQNSSPDPGAVVGIVLGSVAGFIILVWLLSTLTGWNSPVEEEVVVRSRRRRSRSPRRDRIIRQERIVRDSSRPVRDGDRYVEEVRERVGGNTVEVVEEGDSSIVTAPRRDRRRGSSRY